ncbi:divalent cation tolerance protein CutA [Streptomyces sp. 3MP-14]|uniref:Divalent cation tolerance protein CutA n=1 Tax=Streptomyces mimosae TaxID=2586635 RepID=A0A5N6AE75_9ACTN|nr:MULTISPECIES: divalent-cation tolerance protein CutA [Streptomyces]KAB8165818.1 divalent cation tolerance protein CutA [Streptomyces mimosae]KAB8176207.1 divalent cation tolerance protein CutA [Streptomyces sp. 3MP-14]
MADHLVVTTTLDSREAAEAVGRAAVTARLAACAQVEGPITSVYRWEGEVTSDQEWRLVLKTTAARYPELESLVRESHGYEVPQIVATEIVRGGADYLRWLETETTDS